MARKTNTSYSILNVVGRILVAIGKPFSFILSRIVIFILFIVYFIGHTLASLTRKISPRLIFLKLSLAELKLASKIKKSFRNIKLPRFKVKNLTLPFIIFLGLYVYLSIFKSLPTPKNLTSRSIDVSTKIYDRNGTLLYKIYKDKNRTIVPLSQIPPQVRLATLAAEDAEFYSHPGFSIKGIFRAITTDIKTGGKLQGGSTITQQLVKNALLTPDKTINRKIKELILSIEVEAAYTKDQILEMYLNEVSFGGTAYGIEEASEQYFGKRVKDLNLAEAALLAGLPQSPTKYSPFGTDPSSAFARQREVLNLMVVNNYITRDQEKEALNTPLTFVPNKTEIKSPWFVMYVRQLLVDKYGEDMVEKGGLEVTTSLDLQIEEMAESIVSSEVKKLKPLNVGNGASLVLDPSNGEILAMVGSKNYFDIANDGNVNVTTALRQPGSSIKVVNYAYALGHGYTPSSIIDDSPITYSIPGSTPYSPQNYDGKFKGKVTLRTALAESRNIPAVKILASYGVSKMVDLGQKMGITTWTNPSNYGLSLTLGGGATRLTDLAITYSTIANEGAKPTLTPILQIKDYKGKLLEKAENRSTQVIDSRVAYQLIDILKDNNARSGEFGLHSYLVVANHPEVAVKTGTSNDLRDNLTFGFNQNYLVATWVGNNDNSPMSRVASGVTGASPIWNKIMSALLEGKPSVDWKIPEGLTRINCNGYGEWFLKENVPSSYCKPSPSPVPNIKDKKEGRKVPQIL